MRLELTFLNPREKARAIFDRIRSEILAGRFEQHEALPGSRQLAKDFGVARGTIQMSLAMLAADGLIEVRPGSGSYISATVSPRKNSNRQTRPRLSAWARRLPELGLAKAPAYFASGILDTENFPEREWQKAQKVSQRAANFFTHDSEISSAGFKPLRESIAAHLRYSRGVQTDARSIVIVNGSMQAIALLSQIFLDKKDAAAFENPGFHGIWSAIQMTGARGISCRVDQQGMQVPEAKCRLLFVTPASQFPTGITMSQARRGEILAYAKHHDAFIVEDEYDSEFSRLPNPPQPLKLIDSDERVIYIGSFSRTMFSSLRLGYIVLPETLTDIFLRARRLYDSVPPALSDQMAMAHFMRSGAYRLHLRRMNKIYAKRHHLLLEGLASRLRGLLAFQPSAAGLSLYAEWVGPRQDFTKVQAEFAALGLSWQSADRYFLRKPRQAALFGFSHLSEEAIGNALVKIQKSLQI